MATLVRRLADDWGIGDSPGRARHELRDERYATKSWFSTSARRLRPAHRMSFRRRSAQSSPRISARTTATAMRRPRISSPITLDHGQLADDMHEVSGSDDAGTARRRNDSRTASTTAGSRPSNRRSSAVRRPPATGPRPVIHDVDIVVRPGRGGMHCSGRTVLEKRRRCSPWQWCPTAALKGTVRIDGEVVKKFALHRRARQVA